MTARRPSIRLIDAELARPTATSHETHILNRSTEMQLMHEDLARAHAAQRGWSCGVFLPTIRAHPVKEPNT